MLDFQDFLNYNACVDVLQLIQSLKSSPAYRHAFIEEAIRSRLTAQIKALREREGWDYKTFAEKLGKKTSWAYRLEDPNNTIPTIPSLLQVAETFDVGVDVRFVPFSALVDDTLTLGADSFHVDKFGNDARLVERNPAKSPGFIGS